MLAPLYRAAFQVHGTTAAELDACALWQIAAMLDVTPNPSAHEHNKQRVLAARGESAPPTPTATRLPTGFPGGVAS